MVFWSPTPSYVKNWVKMASKWVFIGGGVKNAPPPTVVDSSEALQE